MRDVLFMYTIIHHYSIEGFTPIFISSSCDSVSFFSLFFLCMLVRIILVARSNSREASISIWYERTPTWYQSTRLFKFNRFEELYVLSIKVHPLLYPSLKKSLFLSLQYFLLVFFVQVAESISLRK